jgi:hypothetical protein
VSIWVDRIRDAIETKRCVRAAYGGFVREMCPHVLGYKNGRAQCLFYQFAGGSQSGLGSLGSDQNWRCLPLDGLTAVEIVAGPWQSSPYSRPQTCIDQVEIQVT